MSGGSNESVTPLRDSKAAGIAALRDAVAELNDRVLFGDFDHEQVRDLAAQVAELNRQVELASGQGARAAEPNQGVPNQVEPWRDYRRRSPFAGTANPRAPGLRMRIDVDAPVPTAHGSVTVGAAFAGPPGFVHGGIIAGLLDEAIGWLASATMPDAAVVTGKLSVRFTAPTPVGAPLYLQVAVTKRTSLLMNLTATLASSTLASSTVTVGNAASIGTTPTATAEALMVIKR